MINYSYYTISSMKKTKICPSHKKITPIRPILSYFDKKKSDFSLLYLFSIQ